MTTFESAAALLLAREGHEVGTGISEDVLQAVERDLGVPIRGGYRAFLKRFGWASAGSMELFGLGGPPHLDLVRITLSERTEMHPRLAPQLLPIHNDGFGNLDCVDTRGGAEPPIVFWDHEQGPEQRPERVAPSFAAWLAEQLEAMS